MTDAEQLLKLVGKFAKFQFTNPEIPVEGLAYDCYTDYFSFQKEAFLFEGQDFNVTKVSISYGDITLPVTKQEFFEDKYAPFIKIVLHHLRDELKFLLEQV